MASPVGHAMVGIASAAVVARVTGAPRGPELWLGAFIASGLPDLDLLLKLFGLGGPRFHRNASHSLVGVAVVILFGWAVLELVPIVLDWRVPLAWSAALLSHPLLDVLTTGPRLGEKGYGVGLLWPFHSKRWFFRRPMIDQPTNWGACRSVRDVWRGLRPEVYRLAPVCAVAIALTFIF